MNWKVRRAAQTDLDRLVELVELCLGPGWSRSALAETLTNPLGRVRLIETDGSGAVAGFLVARRVADLVEIDLLGVAPEFRRRGAARVLLEAIRIEEGADGAGALQLELRESNASARALYTGLGFVVVGRRSRYYPDGEDALLWTRTFSNEST